MKITDQKSLVKKRLWKITKLLTMSILNAVTSFISAVIIFLSRTGILHISRTSPSVMMISRWSVSIIAFVITSFTSWGVPEIYFKYILSDFNFSFFYHIAIKYTCVPKNSIAKYYKLNSIKIKNPNLKIYFLFSTTVFSDFFSSFSPSFL